MPNFPYNSFKHQQEKQLLQTMSEAIFALKLNAQDKTHENDITVEDIKQKRVSLADTLNKLIKTIQAIALEGETQENILELDFSYAGIASNFIKLNPKDVHDRVDELIRLKSKLDDEGELLPRDFQLLD
ncbi:MAG: hypothetical protein AAFR81_01255, partial [Chloroflexota bacterium]